MKQKRKKKLELAKKTIRVLEASKLDGIVGGRTMTTTGTVKSGQIPAPDHC